MSSTEQDRARSTASELFEECVVPLAKSRQAAGQQAYFPTEPDSGAQSYYEEPLLRTMQPADFDLPGGGTAEGLIEGLAAVWTAQGETGLVAMVPHLKEIAQALSREAAEGDGNVSILCYTMF